MSALIKGLYVFNKLSCINLCINWGCKFRENISLTEKFDSPVNFKILNLAFWGMWDLTRHENDKLCPIVHRKLYEWVVSVWNQCEFLGIGSLEQVLNRFLLKRLKTDLELVWNSLNLFLLKFVSCNFWLYSFTSASIIPLPCISGIYLDPVFKKIVSWYIQDLDNWIVPIGKKTLKILESILQYFSHLCRPRRDYSP